MRAHHAEQDIWLNGRAFGRQKSYRLKWKGCGMRVGSDEHKRLFCEEFLASHISYEPEELPWPALDDISVARLRALPFWTIALEAEVNAGSMLSGFAATEPDPLVRKALDLQAYEENRHGRLIATMIDRYGIGTGSIEMTQPPTRASFIDFGYNECVDSFAGFGFYKLACNAGIFPESLTSLFSRGLNEEARHIVFFINWVAYDRSLRGYGAPLLQAVPTLLGYAGAIARRAKIGNAVQGNGESHEPGLFDDALRGLTPSLVLQTCIDENERYMSGFDQRLLRPRVIPTIARVALAMISVIPPRKQPAKPAR